LPYFPRMAEAELTALLKLLDTPEPAALGPTRRPGTLAETELDAALKPMLARAKIPAGNGQLICALFLLWHDHLDSSHHIAQGIETADGSFIHAIMHRREPDAGNSKYWWRRVGAHPAFPGIASRAGVLLSQRGAKSLVTKLMPHGKWDANAFVEACDAALSLPDADPQVKLLRELQRIETEVLFEHLASAVK